MGVQLTRLDDRDPTISYSADTWGQAGNGHKFLHTTTRSNRVGAFMRIPFTGTKIIIYGTIDSSTIGSLPHSLISVDDSRGYDFVGKQTSDVQYQQKFYESNDLAPGPHVLAVSITSGSSGRAAFSFDYAEYYALETSSSGSQSSTPASSSITGNTIASDVSTSSSSHGGKPSTLVIVGATFGVVVFLAIILGVLLCVRRRRRRGTGRSDVIRHAHRRASSNGGDTGVTPFIAHNHSPSNQFMSSSNELNNSSSISEYPSATSGGATQTLSSHHDAGSVQGTAFAQGIQSNDGLSKSSGDYNAPPRYEDL